ncbi:sigma-70 family RNA polymerase sigma factor [Cellulomonas sp.]|uniref:RNA polymerase sigma factor n=1 Tax=Cellulomonas sp. TaxID=40001 RepID=UPI002811C9B2|nr:sigma-70 family RNA polymerase sigma factor [Cellulomonas sp.]
MTHSPAPAREPGRRPPVTRPPTADATLTELVARALDGEDDAWAEIVNRHTALVLSRVRQFRLTPPQAEDVAQTVWLNLLEHLRDLREPEALPGWIATATRHECIRVTTLARRSVPVDPTTGRLDVQDDTELDGELLRSERHRALRAALDELPEHQRRLLLLLSTDPPPSYQEVSALLGIPVGSIGPTRQRGLARLRRTAAISSYLAGQHGPALGEGGRDVLALG